MWCAGLALISSGMAGEDSSCLIQGKSVAMTLKDRLSKTDASVWIEGIISSPAATIDAFTKLTADSKLALLQEAAAMDTVALTRKIEGQSDQAKRTLALLVRKSPAARVLQVAPTEWVSVLQQDIQDMRSLDKSVSSKGGGGDADLDDKDAVDADGNNLDESVQGKGQSNGCKVEGWGAKETKRFVDLASYTKMEVDDAIEAEVSVGSTNAFSINLFSNVVDYLDVQVVGDTLKIMFKEGVCNAQAKATVMVTNPLKSLMAQGASKVTVDQLHGALGAHGASEVDVTDLSLGPITCSGSSTVTVKTTNAASIASEGSSTVDVKTVKATFVKVTASGSSEVKLNELDVDVQANLTAQGSSQVDVQTGDAYSLKVTASGSSEVTLNKLDAIQANLTVSGSSSVSGMEVDTLTLVEVSGSSDVTAFVKVQVSGSCDDSSVTIHGAAGFNSVVSNNYNSCRLSRR